MDSYLSFRIGRERYALPVDRVEEAQRMAWPTPVAEAPPEVCGVVNVAGTLVAVVDPGARLGVGSSEPTDSDYLLLVDLPEGRVGLKVSAVEGLLVGSLESAPAAAEVPEFVCGYLMDEGDPVAVLDPEGLVRSEARKAIRRIARQED